MDATRTIASNLSGGMPGATRSLATAARLADAPVSLADMYRVLGDPRETIALRPAGDEQRGGAKPSLPQRLGCHFRVGS